MFTTKSFKWAKVDLVKSSLIYIRGCTGQNDQAFFPELGRGKRHLNAKDELFWVDRTC